ncbi:MAG: LCP family protein [Candidatus Moranbacteria bacterium]|nr:LCP family protein [Candidatus Moranbacteria bacterium]
MQIENTPSRSFLTSLKKLTNSFFTTKQTLLRGEAAGRINILLLGRAGTSYPGKNLTDTVMVMSIDTTTKQVALLSLPRDLYVPIGDTDLYGKLNGVYQYGLAQDEGVEPLKKTIATITGLPIHYFVTIDFDGFEKIVDTLGGISLNVVRDFYDPRYPGKNYSYETFKIKKGWQTLDGATALKYVRERHNDPEGDFGRSKRQQQLIQAIKSKAFSLGTFFNVVTVNNLLDTLGDSVRTDMSLEDMGRFLDLAHNIDTTNVTTVVIDAWKKESLLRVSHIQVGDIAAFILVPRVGNFSELVDTSHTIFHRDEQKKRKRTITKEASTVTLFAQRTDSDAASEIANLLTEEMGFAEVTLVWLPAMDKRQEKSIIVERMSLTKPFSLDELLKKFSLTQMATLPFSTPHQTDSDFNIVLGSDLVETFSLKEATPEELAATNDPASPESFPPQPLKKLR